MGSPLEHELGLYVIHGLLHLNGHDDIDPAGARGHGGSAVVSLWPAACHALNRAARA